MDEEDKLQIACRDGDIKKAKYAIDRGANCFNDGLYRACMGGSIVIVRLMVDHGATSFDCGLHFALSSKHYHIVDFLISKGGYFEQKYHLEAAYEAYQAWKRCVLALPILCEDVLRMVT